MRQIAELIEGHPLHHANTSQSVRDVARLMTERNVGAVAVLDSGKLVGVFSERDLMARVVAPGLDPDKTAVENVMTRNIMVASPRDDIHTAMQKMSSLGCRHLPVVEGGSLLGMLSIRDLLMIDDEDQRKRASFLSELVTYSPDYES